MVAGVATLIAGAIGLIYVLSANHADSPVVGPGAADKVKYLLEVVLEVVPWVVIAGTALMWFGVSLRRR